MNAKEQEYEYTFSICVDVAKMSDSFGKLIGDLNDAMSEFGFHEKLSAVAPLLKGHLTVKKLLTDKEKQVFTDAVIATMQERFPKHTCYVRDFLLSKSPTAPVAAEAVMSA